MLLLGDLGIICGFLSLEQKRSVDRICLFGGYPFEIQLDFPGSLLPIEVLRGRLDANFVFPRVHRGKGEASLVCHLVSHHVSLTRGGSRRII